MARKASGNRVFEVKFRKSDGKIGSFFTACKNARAAGRKMKVKAKIVSISKAM